MVADYFCHRCGRRLKHPHIVGDRVYGVVCVKKVATSGTKPGNLKDARIW